MCCVKAAGIKPAGYEVASACSEEGWRELARHDGRLGEKCEQLLAGILLCVFDSPAQLLAAQSLPGGYEGMRNHSWLPGEGMRNHSWLPSECQQMLVFLRASWSALRVSQVGSQQGSAAWSLGKRCRYEGQEWEDRLLLQRNVPLCCHRQPSAFLMREISSLSPLQSIQLKNTAVLRESKSPLLSLAHIARPRMFKSASYPKSDVSSVVLWMYWAKYMCTTSSCRTPPQRWQHFSGEITLECASHLNINPT